MHILMSDFLMSMMAQQQFNGWGVSAYNSRLMRGFRFFHLLSHVPMNGVVPATTSSQFTTAAACLRKQLRSTKAAEVAMVSIIV